MRVAADVSGCVPLHGIRLPLPLSLTILRSRCGFKEKHANKFPDVEMRELRQKAAAANFALNTFLRAIDLYLTKRAAESLDDLLGPTISGPKSGRHHDTHRRR